jgi:Tol biopolymer transport system component
MTRSTFVSARGDSINGAVSADGAQLAVSVTALAGWGGPSLWIQPTAGSGSQKPIVEKGLFRVAQWSADGAHLIGETQDAETGWDIAYLTLADAAKPVRLTSSPFDEMAPALSPNGSWQAFSSNETVRREVLVSDFPKGARRWQVSGAGGGRPTWRSDGRELYFTGPEGAMAASMTDRPRALEIGTPEHLPFPRDALDLAEGVHSTDGKRFLVLRYEAETFTEPIRLIRGWRQLVER